MQRRVGGIALIALPSAFLAIFFLWPLLSILGAGLFDGIRPDLSAIGGTLTDRRLVGAAWFTLWQALGATALSLGLGLPVAYVFTRYRFPGKNALSALFTVPFVLPTVVVAAAFLAIAGDGGLLGADLSGTIWIVLAAHAFYNVPVVVRTVGSLWRHLDPDLENAARTLGASRWRAFTTVALPQLRPAIAAAASIVFLFTFTSFGVVLLLGAPHLTTIEVEIYRHTALLLDLPTAAVLALAQLIAVAVVLGLYARHQERRIDATRLRPARDTERRPRGRERWLVAGVLGAAIAFLVGPMVVLGARSLETADGIGLNAYRTLGAADGVVDAGAAVANSLGYAVAATVMAVALGMAAAAVVVHRKGRMSRWFDTLLMLPLGTSAVTLGFGFIVALDWPVDLRASIVLVPIAHALVAMPLIVRIVTPVMRSASQRLREAAAVLGAGPVRAWREIDLPLAARAAAVGAAFAFAVSLGEFGATAFVARPGSPTIPVAIFRLLGRPGASNFATAMALSVLLVAITTIAVIAVQRIRPPGSAEF